MRVAVEWVFGDIVNYFKFMNFKKNLKVHLSAVGKMYVCCALIHTQPETRKLQQVCCRLAASCHQADIRMRSHRLLRLDDNKSAASCQQA